MPRADRRRVRRLQTAVAIVTLLMAAGLGWLGYMSWPRLVSDFVGWGKPVTSPNKQWQVRLVDFGGFGPDSAVTTWAEVRRAGTADWRTVYVGDQATLSWQGDLMTFTNENDRSIHTVDARGGRYGLGPPTTVFLPGAVVFIVLVCGILLIVFAPRHVGRSRARALVADVLSQLRAKEWAQAAERFRIDGGQLAGRAELAARLPDCQAATLAAESDWRMARLQRVSAAATRGWLVTVRFPRGSSNVETRDQATVAATADAWLLLPDSGLFAAQRQESQLVVPRRREADPATIGGLVLGVIGCFASLIPLIGILVGLLDLVAVGLAATGYVATRRYGGSVALATVALGVSGLGLLIAAGQAVVWYTVFSLGP